MRGQDRVDDLAIARATAKYAAERVLRFVLAGLGLATQERRRGKQHRRRADAALRRAMGEKSRAQSVDDLFFGAKAFDRLDAARLDLADRGEAGADRLAVDQHRASAAIAGVAADLDAGQPTFL